ncbi:uncharacterized protein RAG0_14562 [Rhynchosporium agropyri]|uniref:Integrase catalytic domain-containing protein n=1 Tax=Rhynchosporium agropyri TaxID=914238 RepID=A0A1E1LHK1_9HELO|nr:uncharacterized protein RAG0_14562 [Rhynchosporium agropyri]
MLTVNRPLRPTGIRSYTIKALKTDGISLVCLYSGSKLNKLGGYLYSSILYTSKEKEIYIINEDLFIIKETSGAGMKFIELKTSRTRLYVLYEKGRPIRKVNKVWRYDGGKEYSPSQIKELTNYLRILLEESTPYTLEQDGRAERSIRTIIEKSRRKDSV